MKIDRHGLWILCFIVLQNFAFSSDDSNTAKRQAYLKQLQSVLPEEHPDRGRVSPLDATWKDWLDRTGELPPDFESMPSLPFLPDPLVLDEGGKNIPVRTMSQWEEKRAWMRAETQRWITGTFPPPPDNLEAKIVNEQNEGDITIRTVELTFGPDRKAKLTLELFIPPGSGPFPVFLTPGIKEYCWISVAQAVQRGYLACAYAGCDTKDDTEGYAEIWYPQYDFTRLMRRAWGAYRAIDYLYTLPIVNRDQIALTGLSRDGKQVLMAAAFDERIKAVVPCSGGTGAEDPIRYNTDPFDNETIVDITTNFPHWLHPRLRFFIGREDKLPVDQNLLMALVAPRGLLISSAITEDQGNPWGIEQNYLSVLPVYQFLGVEQKVGLHLRHGYHPPAARDIETYVDFFDFIFERGKIPPPRIQYYDYSFSKWRGLSGENVNPQTYPPKGIEDLLIDSQGREIQTVSDWEQKKSGVQKRIQWGLGEQPPGVNPGFFVDYLREVIVKPKVESGFNKRPFMQGEIYFPADEKGEPIRKDLPVVVYLHEYAYPTGYTRHPFIQGFLDRGFAVYLFDQIGFGSRIQEGTLFYERFPHWSKLGRMLADTRWSIDALSHLDFIDAKRIYVFGYSLGATVGLYASALDDRIAGTIAVCGFSPMRLETVNSGFEGIRAFSHLHGLLPRLGFFVGDQNRIPYDYHEILASIAPRPLLIVAPQWDRYADFAAVRSCVDKAKKVYCLYDAEKQLEFLAPDDYNRFSPDMQQASFDWLKNRLDR